ncbi:MAG: hypothetical protein WA824_17030 [Candidatus Sulfotelmatobacter sp.]
MARTSFSVKSVATPELFFGQLTHNIPAGASSLANWENCFDNCVRDFVNSMAKSITSGFFGSVHGTKASRSSV